MSVTSSSSPPLLSRSRRIKQIVLDVLRRYRGGEQVDEQTLLAAHPDLLPELAEQLARAQRIAGAMEAAAQQRLAQVLSSLEDDWQRDGPAGDQATGADERVRDGAGHGTAEPQRIGRYRICGLIGDGGFGRVYLARDDQLARDVAIKVPHLPAPLQPAEIDAYLSEARFVAALDHPAIVPVYDAGVTDDGHPYVVSKLIRGEDLQARMSRAAIDWHQAVKIVIAVAEGLHCAHQHNLVHRDVKPANILLDEQGQPYITDFGLARRDDDLAEGGGYVGTPAYMSPEQARGEAHRVDRRSDVFSLGVVLYELLTGHKPFRSPSYRQLLAEIVQAEPRPPRSWDPALPAELERICLKALSRRASDRYSTAAELADDLRRFLHDHQTTPGTPIARPPAAAARATTPAKVAPKGLRPFDAEDADFFLQLVPGPRDRRGLPECIAHWKKRIEEVDREDTFTVGLWYGPSGCGKSSLVRAGLVPRLARHVQTVYFEAMADNTEERLLDKLRRHLPQLPPRGNLAECLAAVRRGRVLPPGRKLLIVIDQLEQWLHGRDSAERQPLVQALRHCDGRHLQCLLLVRDDFWLAVSRFFAELEIDLVQGHNAALIDLFDLPHARRVLVQFGQAYDRLPAAAEQMSTAEKGFVERAVQSLAEDGQVIPVRLALFAEMVKGKPWTPATLRNVGGAEGVGVAFLQSTFSARTANPQHRAHEKAARAVLAALLPEPGPDIKGRVRSSSELLDISGYGDQPRAFKELMWILDSQTRLLTPADPEIVRRDDPLATPCSRYYQLTHDYLVPALRQWLTRKRRSTLLGRMEIRLAERCMMWKTRRERRQLPSWWEWIAIRALTRPANWTPSQREMMRTAGRQYAATAAGLLGVLLAGLLAISQIGGWTGRVMVQLRARLAVVQAVVGQEDAIRPLLRHSSDPTLRSTLIHQLGPAALGADSALRQLQVEQDVSVRRALLLVIGQQGRHSGIRRGPSMQRHERLLPDQVVDQLQQIYLQDPDAGIHAAAAWALRRIGQQHALPAVRHRPPAALSELGRFWFETVEGHTMVIVAGPTSFLMGSPETEPGRGADEPLHQQHLWTSFAIASCETTAAQLQRFRRQRGRSVSRPVRGDDANCAASGVSWYEAAAYCNWLSQQEGIPPDQWCYLPNEDGQYAAGMRIAPDFPRRRGYRLPTEAEWELACRAGASTPWFFGTAASLLDQYAVFRGSGLRSPAIAASRKPNDVGLFDALGNVEEWCQDVYTADPTVWQQRQDRAVLLVQDEQPRVVRGGSFSDPADRVRCASRASARPALQSNNIGFRVARSLP